jgi:NADPH:quinone reductase-like Zn-dependent oxidoreductase
MTMRAAVCPACDEKIANCIEIIEIDVPSVVPENTVLVRIHGASVNPIDFKLITGHAPFKLQYFPFHVGFDFAGVVAKVGDNSKFNVGDEVYGDTGGQGGTFAEYVMIHESHVGLKPTNVPFLEAATIPLAGLTAVQGYGKALAKLAVQENLKVCIYGASGGVGGYAVQWGKYKGYHVVGVCSTKNVDFVRGLGADDVIDYSVESDFDRVNDNSFDFVYDCVGGPTPWTRAHQNILKPGGAFVTIAGGSGPTDGFGVTYDIFMTDSTISGDYDLLKEAFEKDGMKTNISQVFAFDKAGVIDLMETAANNRAQGKLALRIV